MPFLRLIITMIAIAIGFAGEPASNPPGKDITFSKDIAPIFYRSCIPCHSPGRSAPMSLMTYREARPWARFIKELVANRQMPPAKAGHLSQSDIELIVTWIDQGSKEGKREDLPPVPKLETLADPLATQRQPDQPAASQAEVADRPMSPVAPLAGGMWRAEGKWPDGSPLRVEVKYYWGPTRRVLHFETYDLATGLRKLLYEGLLFYDQKRDKIVQWNFKPTGERDESEVTAADSEGYEMKGENTWSLIRYKGVSEFAWELRVRQEGEWKTILNITYRRER